MKAEKIIQDLKKGEMEEKDLILIAIFVDDILIASRDPVMVKSSKSKLSTKFEIKHFVGYCLVIEIVRDDILICFGMTEANHGSTPMDIHVKLTKNLNMSKGGRRLSYQELIGCLDYLSVTMRLDISFVVSCLAQFNNSYGKSHWTAAKRVIHHLKRKMNLEINIQTRLC
ncbi:hypothetical protein JTB14_002510 [Gonioctena quinquepunctata]|nr:hypothetical protein JTB14_002510 [Gonioctena quinquepunctata]